MLSQVVYETNADLTASHEAVVKNPLVVADRTEKGLLWFKFKNNGTVFLLSPFGKLQVKWNDVSEKRTLFRLVRSLLVAKPNEKLEIKPLKQQTWIEYPVPESFKLYWCDLATEFVLKKTELKKEETKGPEGASLSPENVNGKKGNLSAEVELVRQVLNGLRGKLLHFREPTLEEVALRLGRELGSVLEMLLGFAGWKRQRSWDEAEKAAEKVIDLTGCCAGRRKATKIQS